MITWSILTPHFITIPTFIGTPKNACCKVEPNCYGEKVAPGELAKPQANEPEVYDEVYREADYQWWAGWWFQIFFIFTPTWGNDPIWLIFFRWVENTTYIVFFSSHTETHLGWRIVGSYFLLWSAAERGGGVWWSWVWKGELVAITFADMIHLRNQKDNDFTNF